MSDGRLQGKVAIVVGAGQTPGPTVGNGRATAIRFAREGALVVAADRDLASAVETAGLIAAEGNESFAVQVDVTSEDDVARLFAETVQRWGRVDILQNNVGVSVLAGDAELEDISADGFARIIAINLGGMVLTSRLAVAQMRQQGSGGVIINISSNAAIIDYPYVGYKTSKAAIIALTEQTAIRQAEHGIRVNTILPGLMDTPMAIEYRVGSDGRSREEIIADRASRVPLRGRGGTAWDVASASTFLASDEAAFITGTSLVVDGGQSLRAG